jgi:hypothetical protein
LLDRLKEAVASTRTPMQELMRELSFSVWSFSRVRRREKRGSYSFSSIEGMLAIQKVL